MLQSTRQWFRQLEHRFGGLALRQLEQRYAGSTPEVGARAPHRRPAKRSCVSQFGQDVFIAEVLMRGRPGFYVDVGARDGIHISNTLQLERNYGWTGILIEPHPDLYAELKVSRRHPALNFAISNTQGKMKFVKLLEEPLGNSGLLSTFPDPRRLPQLRHEIIEVPCKPLASVLAERRIKRIDYLDIDVEGHEFEVLSSLDLYETKIEYIGVECPLTRPPETRAKIIDHLAAHGYHPFAQLGSDTFFATTEPPLLKVQ